MLALERLFRTRTSATDRDAARNRIEDLAIDVRKWAANIDVVSIDGQVIAWGYRNLPAAGNESPKLSFELQGFSDRVPWKSFTKFTRNTRTNESDSWNRGLLDLVEQTHDF